LNEAWFSGFFEVDFKEGFSVRVDGLAGVPAVVLKVQRGDDQVTARAMANNLYNNVGIQRNLWKEMTWH
jgi:hypothetical protein